MSASERRAEIMRILVGRRKCYLSDLAQELGVSKRTIQRDVQTLVLQYPLESIPAAFEFALVTEWYQHIGILPYARTGRTTQREVHGRRKGTVSGDSPTEGTLQRLNNYFGGRQYREVFEENQALINELKKILSR